MYGIIYKATNNVNGKIYIGQTTMSLKERIRRHRYACNTKKLDLVFYKAIRKYGFKNFNWEVIDSSNDKYSLDEKEVYWIRKFNTFIKFENCNGYNMTIGGESLGSGENHPNFGKEVSDETRLKLRVANSGKNHPNFGKKLSYETRLKMSVANKFKGENHPFLGKNTRKKL